MLFKDQANDRQAQSVTAGCPVARTVEAGESLEDELAVLGRDANAIVILNNLTQILELEIEDKLESLRPLFTVARSC